MEPIFTPVQSHTHNGVDSPQISYNDLTDAPAGGSSGGGWSLVSYNTASSASSITVSGLNLATAKHYHILIHCRNITAAGIVQWQTNSDSTANKHHWITTGYHATSGIVNTGSESDTKWDLSGSGTAAAQIINLHLSYNSGYVLGNWNMTGNGYGGDATLRMSTATGGGYWNDSTNVSSFALSHNSGANCDWAVWVYKTSQS